ncbi:uncharacterized protein LOC119614502 [Lucilia sericata]|uniref:uncharacterized protein LOC119614502 n=1 Tax=Lucilia sericata TaxID=13632 RepID=UPI0018A7FDDE|nr:uncharacterized protein LOC119614502 [Lucilia sericata]
MIKLLILIIAIAEVFSLECYICENFETARCLKPEKYQDILLKECGRNETKCALLVEKTTDISLIRKCVTENFKCDSSKYNCETCETDACNTGNEVKKPIQNVVTANLVMSNIYRIGAIALVITVLIIWCVIKICQKKDDIDYEEDDDCDEYYENETNIDLEETSIQKC